MARFDPNFSPLLLEDQTAIIFGAGLPTNGKSVRCKAVGALPELLNDFGTLAAATWSGDLAVTNLYMNTMELAQYRMRVIDDVKVRLKSPSAVSQWRTRDSAFELPQFPLDSAEQFLKVFYWMQSEFFVFEDADTPRFNLYSVTTVTVSRVLFSGWRFRLEEIAEPGRIKVWISDWPK